jgi:transmembrane sensor
VNEEFEPSEGPDRTGRDPIEVAAFWHGRLEDGEPDAHERERFEAWLAADPRHRAAYESVERSWTGLANAAMDERILSMRREALKKTPKTPKTPKHRMRPTAIAASILVAVLVIGLLIRLGPRGAYPNGAEFATQVGQRSSITLADGSTVVLNTASRIRVAFDPQVRRVRLLAGQAWFEVAKNQRRPFVVEAGDRRVTAHGTAFDVRLEDHDQVQVTLIEGRVSVEALKAAGAAGSGPIERVDLLPGDQLVAAVARPATKHKTDLAKATSWREGQLIFDDDTLETAVAEVNRYSTERIVLADPRLKSLRMSGVFIAGHTDSFVETVTGHFPIKATPDSDGQLLLTATN